MTKTQKLAQVTTRLISPPQQILKRQLEILNIEDHKSHLCQMMCKKPNKVFRCIENSYIRPAAEIRSETTTRQCGKIEI